jgi:hypothetical protein
LFTISIVNGGAFHFVSAGGAGRYWWNRINDDHKSSLDLTPHGFTRKLRNDDFSNRPNNRNVPLKDATFENYETMWNRFELDMWAHPALLGMFTGDNRLWFTKQALQVIPTDKFYKEFVRRSVDVSAPILLVHAPADMAKIRERDVMTQDDNRLVAQIEKLPGSQAVPAKLLRYTPNHLDFEVTCPESGWLLITDRWAHGWRVKLNGSAAKVFGGDFIFRAVQVHAGTNTIQFSYLPFGFPGLFILSWSALVCIFLGPVIKRRIENLQRRSAGSDSLIEPVRASASQIRPN